MTTDWGFYDEDVEILLRATDMHGDARGMFLLEHFGPMRLQEALQATEALMSGSAVDLGDGTVLMRDFT